MIGAVSAGQRSKPQLYRRNDWNWEERACERKKKNRKSGMGDLIRWVKLLWKAVRLKD